MRSALNELISELVAVFFSFALFNLCRMSKKALRVYFNRSLFNLCSFSLVFCFCSIECRFFLHSFAYVWHFSGEEKSDLVLQDVMLNFVWKLRFCKIANWFFMRMMENVCTLKPTTDWIKICKFIANLHVMVLQKFSLCYNYGVVAMGIQRQYVFLPSQLSESFFYLKFEIYQIPDVFLHHIFNAINSGDSPTKS